MAPKIHLSRNQKPESSGLYLLSKLRPSLLSVRVEFYGFEPGFFIVSR